MGLERRKIDWRKNPIGTAENIDHNFSVLFNAFENLVNERFESITLRSINAERIFSGSSDLSSLFVPKKESLIKSGFNIDLSDDPNSTVISVSKTPSFDRIYSGDTDLSSIFISKNDIKDTLRPNLGMNLFYSNLKNGICLEMDKEPIFEEVKTNGISANTARFDTIIYQGRSLDELLPSYQLPEDAPYLNVIKLDWRKNPAVTGNEINQNFDRISRAFNTLLQHKLNDVSLEKVIANEMILCGSSINELFIPKDAEHDIVRISSGRNITTGGTQNSPIIHVSDNPVFSSITANIITVDDITLEGKNILDVLYTRKEARNLSHPHVGRNLIMANDKGTSTIHVSDDPSFGSLTSISITANTITTNTITFNGGPIERLFGSDTFIKAGKNISTGGTKNNPIISVVDQPVFVSLHSDVSSSDQLLVNAMTGVTALFNSIRSSNDLSVSNTFFVDNKRVNMLDNFHLIGDRVTIGGEPEMEVSSFLRTKVRILATQSSPIHYAFIIQKKEHESKRVLNDDTVDFVVRGDGNVGIGAFIDISSKLTIKSKNGFDQLRLSTQFTPSGTDDDQGKVGNISWDEDYMYVKTASGWKRSGLHEF